MTTDVPGHGATLFLVIRDTPDGVEVVYSSPDELERDAVLRELEENRVAYHEEAIYTPDSTSPRWRGQVDHLLDPAREGVG